MGPLTLVTRTGAAEGEAVTKGRLFFRVVAQQDGHWSCRRGREELDSHADLAEAVEHMTALAGQHRPSEVLVHPLGAAMRSVATFD
jgi:hypothetical protein